MDQFIELLQGKMEQIQDDIDGNIETLKDQDEGTLSDEAINWGDLRCVNVQYCVAVTGEDYFLATVEEAKSYRLAQVLSEMVSNKHGMVYVRTEW